MKVLVIVPDPVPYGGTSRFLERLLEIHAGQGIESILLVPSERCHAETVSLAERFGALLVREANRVRRDTPPFLTPVFDFLFSWRTVLRHRPDLIVVSTGDPGRATVACFYPVPVLYVLHTIPEQRFRPLARAYLQAAFLPNNRVMTVSRAAAAQISEATSIPSARIEVVYNSCRLSGAAASCSAALVLTVGHHVAYKDPELWLEVACRVLGRFPEATFAWLGDGDLLEATRREVRQRGLEERVLLPGYVAEPEEWYRRAKVYFQPSLRENHSIAVLEAMAHGLPCVVSDAGGLPESVQDQTTGLVCPARDGAGFSRSLLQLLCDPALRRRLGDAGRRRVETDFSPQRQEDRLLTLYRNLATDVPL